MWSIADPMTISAGLIPATHNRPETEQPVHKLYKRNELRLKTMDLHNLVNADCVVSKLKASSKKQALQELANKAAEVTGLDAGTIFDKLIERERLGTTGVGQGIAIPHGKFEELDTVRGLFARLETPIDFEAMDDQPVDLIFVLLAPEPSGADHLKALARVSRLLRDQSMCAKLRGADTADALFALLTETEKTRAA